MVGSLAVGSPSHSRGLQLTIHCTRGIHGYIRLHTATYGYTRLPTDAYGRLQLHAVTSVTQVCQLRLVSAAELTKTYHHLFPVPPYVETKLPIDPEGAPPMCFACREVLPRATRDGVEVTVRHVTVEV